MKKITYSLLLSFLATIIFLSSCKKKVAEEVVKPAPTLSFMNGTGYTFGAVTVTPSSKIKVGWNAAAAGGNLKTFSVDRDGNAVPEFVSPKTISGATYSNTIEITVPAQPAPAYTYNFKVTTDDGKTASASIVVKVAAAIGGEIMTYTGISLGAQTNSNIGNFFSSISGLVYKEVDAKMKSDLVNFVHYLSGTTAYLASPTDASAQTVFPSIMTWDFRKSTLFKPTSAAMTAEAFDGLTGDNKIIGEYEGETSIPESKSVPLTVGKVISFKTHTNKLGLIKITSLTTDVNGTITFDVKVQK